MSCLQPAPGTEAPRAEENHGEAHANGGGLVERVAQVSRRIVRSLLHPDQQGSEEAHAAAARAEAADDQGTGVGQAQAVGVFAAVSGTSACADAQGNSQAGRHADIHDHRTLANFAAEMAAEVAEADEDIAQEEGFDQDVPGMLPPAPITRGNAAAGAAAIEVQNPRVQEVAGDQDSVPVLGAPPASVDVAAEVAATEVQVSEVELVPAVRKAPAVLAAVAAEAGQIEEDGYVSDSGDQDKPLKGAGAALLDIAREEVQASDQPPAADAAEPDEADVGESQEGPAGQQETPAIADALVADVAQEVVQLDEAGLPTTADDATPPVALGGAAPPEEAGEADMTPAAAKLVVAEIPRDAGNSDPARQASATAQPIAPDLTEDPEEAEGQSKVPAIAGVLVAETVPDANDSDLADAEGIAAPAVAAENEAHDQGNDHVAPEYINAAAGPATPEEGLEDIDADEIPPIAAQLVMAGSEKPSDIADRTAEEEQLAVGIVSEDVTRAADGADAGTGDEQPPAKVSIAAVPETVKDADTAAEDEQPFAEAAAVAEALDTRHAEAEISEVAEDEALPEQILKAAPGATSAAAVDAEADVAWDDQPEQASAGASRLDCNAEPNPAQEQERKEAYAGTAQHDAVAEEHESGEASPLSSYTSSDPEEALIAAAAAAAAEVFGGRDDRRGTVDAAQERCSDEEDLVAAAEAAAEDCDQDKAPEEAAEAEEAGGKGPGSFEHFHCSLSARV